MLLNQDSISPILDLYKDIITLVLKEYLNNFIFIMNEKIRSKQSTRREVM